MGNYLAKFVDLLPPDVCMFVIIASAFAVAGSDGPSSTKGEVIWGYHFLSQLVLFCLLQFRSGVTDCSKNPMNRLIVQVFCKKFVGLIVKNLVENIFWDL